MEHQGKLRNLRGFRVFRVLRWSRLLFGAHVPGASSLLGVTLRRALRPDLKASGSKPSIEQAGADLCQLTDPVPLRTNLHGANRSRLKLSQYLIGLSKEVRAFSAERCYLS